jgi:tetratricopeptide (TPR) repeat protein
MSAPDLGKGLSHQDRMRTLKLKQARQIFQACGYRHAKYYLVYAQDHCDRFLALDEELENILTSLHYVQGKSSLCRIFAKTALSIHDYMLQQGHWTAWESILSAAISTCGSKSADREKAELLTKLSSLLINMGSYEEAESRLILVLELSSRVPSIDIEIKTSARRHMATLMLRKGRSQKALELLQEALDSLARSEIALKGQILLHQSNVHHLMGNNQLALDTLRKAELIFLAKDDRRHLAGVFNLYGLIYRSTSAYRRAASYFLKALGAFQSFGDRVACATVHCNLGFSLWTIGEFQNSARHLHQSLQIAREMGYRRMAASSYGNLGLVYMDLGDFEKALGCLNMQIQICQDIGDEREYGRAVGNLGILHYQMGHFRQALQCLDVDRDILLSSGIQSSETLAYNSVYRGLAHYELGEKKSASIQIRESLQTARKVGSRTVEILALRGMSRVEPSESKGYLEQALELATELGKKLDMGICKFELGLLAGPVGQEVRCALLMEAQAIFEELSAQAWLAKAQSALGSPGFQADDRTREQHQHDQCSAKRLY